MGNDISSDISREDLLEIQKRQLLLEEQNKKIKNALEKERRSKASLKTEINELKTTMGSSKTTRGKPVEDQSSSKHKLVSPKNTEKISVKVNKSTVQVDPYTLFGLEPNCSLEDIKKVYKQLVIKYHPDKSGYNSEDDYKTLQKTYALLCSIKQDELRINGLLKQTIETKKEERKDLDSHIDRRNNQFQPASGEGFDRNKFNEMYEQNRFLDDDQDDGYANWLKETHSEQNQPNIGSFTKDGFNNAFEQHARQHSNSKQVAQFIEPDSYFSYSGGFDSLGGGGIDYGSDGKYTDLKKAYTQANILHPGEVKNREQYTTISQLKAARDAPIQLTREEQEFMANKQRMEQEHESNRVNKLREKDKKIEDFYTRLHGRSIELPTYKRP
jgi:curved DNA-binding protein CbpA